MEKKHIEKVIKYSIRKFSVGVGSAVIGAVLFGANNLLLDQVAANEVCEPNQVHYRYLAEQELTEAEKGLIHKELPSDLKQDDVVYLVYRKKEVHTQYLPNTGSKELGLVGFGFATAALAVLVFSKKRPNKIAGILFIGALGGSYFIPQTIQAFENQILLSYNQTISACNQEDLANGVIQIDGYDYIGYFKEADLKVSMPENNQDNNLITDKVTQEAREGESLVQPELPTYSEETTTTATQGETQGSESLVQPEPPVHTSEETTESTQEEAPIGESPVQPELPAQPENSTAKGTQEEGHVGESPIQPELPAYTGEVTAKGTQEEGHVGESPNQPELPAYTGEVTAKGTQEEGQEENSRNTAKLTD